MTIVAIVLPSSLWGALDRSHLTSSYPRMDTEVRKKLIEALAAFLPKERLISQREELMAYSYDATAERHLPDVVVLPETTVEVQNILRTAYDLSVYVIGRGAASNISGGTLPVVGGLVLSLARMKRVRSMDALNHQVVVEPGLVNADLQAFLHPHGFFYAPDPSSHRISTLGGNIAENSGGPHCVKYGVTTNHVLSLELVTVSGDVVELPLSTDTRSTYDLTGLVVGSEGTLGIVTAMTLRILPLPEASKTLLAVFPDIETSLSCVSSIIAQGIVPATLELMDSISIEVAERYMHSGYPLGAKAVLLIEVDGAPNVLDSQIAGIQEVSLQQGCLAFRVAKDAREADLLWKGRRSLYGAAAQLAPHLWVQDVTVPRPHLASMMQEVLSIGKRYGFVIMTAAHAGDGNLHPILPYDPSDKEQVIAMKQADQEILQACIKYGGSITGEHGIGVDKLETLALMYNDEERGLMMRLKKAMDDKGIANPLKAVLPPAEPLLTEPDYVATAPSDIRDVQDIKEAVAYAHHHQKRILPFGAKRRLVHHHVMNEDSLSISLLSLQDVVDFDPENLTIEVGAGMNAGKLRQILGDAGLDLAYLPRVSDETVGGLIASNARNLRGGTGFGWRDAVIGVHLVDGRGVSMHFGGKAVKNVAGYDVSKLAVGSWGTLGVLTQCTLRLTPAPLEVKQVSIRGGLGELWQISEMLRQKPVHPQAMVIQHACAAKEATLHLSLEGPQVASMFLAVQQLGDTLALDLHYTSDFTLLSALEMELNEQLYTAMAAHAYHVLPVLPGEFLSLADLYEQPAWLYYPMTATLEVFRTEPNRPQVKASILRLQNGIKTAFDPYQRFYGFSS